MGEADSAERVGQDGQPRPCKRCRMQERRRAKVAPKDGFTAPLRDLSPGRPRVMSLGPEQGPHNLRANP